MEKILKILIIIMKKWLNLTKYAQTSTGETGLCALKTDFQYIFKLGLADNINRNHEK